jgi:hypothetical protein
VSPSSAPEATISSTPPVEWLDKKKRRERRERRAREIVCMRERVRERKNLESQGPIEVLS